MYTGPSLQLLNGDSALCLVLTHTGAALHQNQHNSEIRIFCERFGTPPGFSLPGVLLPELLQLSFQVDLQQRSRQPGQAIQYIHASAGLASAKIRSHDEHPQSVLRIPVAKTA
jgi:hypothetical protein